MEPSPSSGTKNPTLLPIIIPKPTTVIKLTSLGFCANHTDMLATISLQYSPQDTMKPTPMNPTGFLRLTSLLLATVACQAHADVVSVSEVNDDPTYFDSAVTTSLITAGQSSLSYMTGNTPTGGFPLSGVNDGLAINGDTNTLTYYDGLGSATVTFRLTQGYDITSIAALSGWVNAYFGSHSFSVLLETGSSGIYTSIGIFGQRAYTPTAPSGFPEVTDNGFSIRTTITDDGVGGVIASNVTGIKFVFTDPYPDIPTINGIVIRELSVVGTATDPVPTSSPAIGGPIIPAVGEPAGASTNTSYYPAAGYGFYTPAAGTTVNRIGYWDQGGDGLAVSHDVMIVGYNGSNYSEVVRVTIPAGTAARLEGGFRWVKIPELTLPNIGQGADYYGIVASCGADPWSNGLGGGVPMTPFFGTKASGGLVGGTSAMAAGNVYFNGAEPGWGGANFGYEPPTTVPTRVDTRVKIMPLGDSITAGYTDNANWNEPFEFGYRGPLATAFINSGLPFKFVGLSAEPFNNASGDPSHNATAFPVNELRDPAINQGAHRGYGGWSIANINANVAAWIATDDPDVILLHIGTNGISGSSPGELNTLVGNIFAAKPTVKLVVAQIMPAIGYNADVIAYNTYIRDTLVPAYIGAGRDISTVDQYANFLTDPEDHTSIDPTKFSNGINHPSNAAYGLMATTWLPAITPITLSGNSIPATTTTGSTLGSLTRLGAADGETLTYSLVSGAESTDNGSFTIVGNQLRAGSHSFDTDPAGASYRIRVQVVGSVTGTATQNFRLTRAAGAANPHPISIATVNDSSQTAYEADVRNDDLLQGVAGTFTYLQSAGGPLGQRANDGLNGGVQEHAALAWAADGNISSFTYEIGVGYGVGYDVSTIQTIAAWGDSGFMNQKYKVSVRYAGATEYVPAPECTVDYQPVTDIGNVPGATKVTITRPGGMIFSRIEGIRFTCLNVVNNTAGGSTTFREIDVEGAATTLSPFESFMKTNYPELTGSASYAASDPDNDGFSNLQEYAFGTDPGVSSSGPITYAAGVVTGHGQPTTQITNITNGVDYRAVFGRRNDYVAAGLTYTVQFSAGLDIWVDSTDTPTVLASDSTMDAVSVPYPLFITTANGVEKPTFFRVGVSSN